VRPLLSRHLLCQLSHAEPPIAVFLHPALAALPPPTFKLIVDSAIWAIKHSMRDIADIGLNFTLEMIDNFAKTEEPGVADGFFQAFTVRLVTDILSVLVDPDHKSGFKTQSVILQRLIHFSMNGLVKVPIYDPAAVPTPGISNAEYLRDYINNLMQTAFPHLQAAQIRQSVELMFVAHEDPQKFKLALRDFLSASFSTRGNPPFCALRLTRALLAPPLAVTMKEFSGDEAETFFVDKEAEKAEQQAKDLETAMRVPGMLKPSQIDEEEL
jgi:exportin-1